MSSGRIQTSRWRCNVLPIASIVLAATACAGPRTDIELTWAAPRAQTTQLHRVVTLFVSRDVALRRPAEEKMAKELEVRGVQAMPSYQLLGRDDLSNLDAARRKLREQGYDGVVTMRIVDREQKLNFVPPTFDMYWHWASPYFYWPGFYTPDVYSPGYVYTTTIVRMETDAYSLVDDRLVWSALSRTTSPDNARELVDDVTKKVASRLTRNGLVG